MVSVVVGVTPRPESEAALQAAIAEAQLRGAHLHIVRTAATQAPESFARVASWEREVADIEAGGRELVADLAHRGVEASFRVEAVASDPATVLLEVVDEVGGELLVIGLRRRSAVGKLVLGSVAQDVLLGAECAVLAVHASSDADTQGLVP